MTGESQPTPPPPPVWAYAYRMVPPQAEHRLRALKAILDRERSSAAAGARTWKGQLVVERQVTHVLIVSDTPELDTEANHRVEDELRRLNAGFAVTVPLAAGDDGREA